MSITITYKPVTPEYLRSGRINSSGAVLVGSNTTSSGGGTVDLSGYVTIPIYSGYTATTAPATYVRKTIYATYTGTTAPATFIKCSAAGVQTINNDLNLDAAGTRYMCVTGYQNGTTAGAGLVLAKSHSATATLACTQNNDYLGLIYFKGVNSSAAWTSGVSIDALQVGAAGATYIPAQLRIRMGNGTAYNEVMRLCNNGIICTTGCAISNGIISTGFTAGYLTGAGYCLGNNGNMEVSNLTVRCALNATELRINRIKASSDLMVSAGGVKALSGLTWDNSLDKWYFAVTTDDIYTLQPSDFIKSQQFNGTDIHSATYSVISANTTTNKVYITPTYDSCSLVSGIAITNTSISPTWTDVAGVYYNAVSNAQNQYAETAAQAVCKGILKTQTQLAVTAGCVGVALYNGSTLYCSLGTYSSSGTYYKCVCIPVAGNLKIRYTNAYAGTTCFCAYKPSITKCGMSEFPEVSNWEFVQIGNSTDTDRQSLIEISANQTAAPYIRVLDGVNVSSPNASMEKLRLGNLDGICGLTGYGLYSENTYMKGYVNACAGGQLGVWCINSTDLSNTYITLGGTCISVKDNSEQEKIVLKNAALTAVASLAGASCVTFNLTTANAADCRVDLTCNQSAYCCLFYMQCIAGSNAGLDAYTSTCATKNLTLTTSKNYLTNASIKVCGAYTLCADDTDYTADCITCTHTLGGWYCVSGNSTIYNCVGTALISCAWTTGTISAGSPYTRCTIPSTNVYVDQPAVYMQSNYCIFNYQYQCRCVKCYCCDGIKYYQCCAYSDIVNLTNCICIEQNCLALVGAVGVTEIASCGLQSVYGTGNYFRYDSNNCTTTICGCALIDGTCTCVKTPANFCNTLTVYGTFCPRAVNYCACTRNAATVLICNQEAMTIWTYSSGAGTACLPNTPTVGETHIIINATTGRALTICSCGSICFWDNGVEYANRPLTCRQSFTFVYNGTAWSSVAYR